MLPAKIKYYLSYSLYILIAIFVVMCNYSSLLVLKLGTATVLLSIPIVIYSGFYFGEYFGAITGLIIGGIMDTYSSTMIFNTAIMVIIGLVSGLLINYLFNRNLAAAVTINTVVSILYFFVKWIIVYAFVDPNPLYILLKYSFSSAIINAAIGTALFFIYNLFLNKISLRSTGK